MDMEILSALSQPLSTSRGLNNYLQPLYTLQLTGTSMFSRPTSVHHLISDNPFSSSIYISQTLIGCHCTKNTGMSPKLCICTHYTVKVNFKKSLYIFIITNSQSCYTVMKCTCVRMKKKKNKNSRGPL